MRNFVEILGLKPLLDQYEINSSAENFEEGSVLYTQQGRQKKSI